MTALRELRSLGNSVVLRWTVAALGLVLVLSVTQELARPETTDLISSGTAEATLRRAVPILLAGLGGIWAERAGVVNIGLEGMMILGAWFGAWGALEFGPWWGIVIGIAGGAAGGLLHAVATVGFGVDHIISGVAINILAPALARFLSREVFAQRPGGGITQSPRLESVGHVDIPFLSGGDLFGWSTPDIFGWLADRGWFIVSDVFAVASGVTSNISWATLLALLLVPATVFVLWYTPFGLRVRASGEHPVAADSLGVNTRRIDSYTFAFGSGLAGLAGYALTLIGGVTPDMGQNYIVESFLVVVTGGAGELLGVICSGLGLGVATKVIEPMQFGDFTVEAIWAKVFVLACVVAFIQFKPAGLFPPKGRLADV